MSQTARKHHVFEIFSSTVAEWAGRPVVFVAAFALIVAWAISGPVFGYSETWQLVINTATTIVTFLMVFVLQNSQNRDVRALQAKLDELILTSQAENSFIGIEKLEEREIALLIDRLEQQARTLRKRVGNGGS